MDISTVKKKDFCQQFLSKGYFRVSWNVSITRYLVNPQGLKVVFFFAC